MHTLPDGGGGRQSQGPALKLRQCLFPYLGVALALLRSWQFGEDCALLFSKWYFKGGWSHECSHLEPFCQKSAKANSNWSQLILHTGYKHNSYFQDTHKRKKRGREFKGGKRFHSQSRFTFLFLLFLGLQKQVLNTGHLKSPTCYLQFTLWRCFCVLDTVFSSQV